MKRKSKKIIYIDMDNTIVDFQSGIDACTQEELKYYKADEIPCIFLRMKPRKGAIEAVKVLNEFFDVYILTTAPWKNPSAWSDKVLWIQKYFGDELKKKVIISHHKNLLLGDYLIDDSPNNGAADFHGVWLHFLENERDERGYATIDWEATLNYIFQEENIKKY